MSLTCKAAVIAFTVVSAVACGDPAAPVPPVAYRLDNVSGRPLPTFISPIPEEAIIIGASLELDATDRATLTELLRQMSGAVVTRTNNYTYTITGNQIQFDYDPPCPPNALCVEPPRGTIAGDELSLSMFGSGGEIVYNFRVSILD